MSEILQNSGFYHMGLSFLFVSPAYVCQIFIFMLFFIFIFYFYVKQESSKFACLGAKLKLTYR